MDRQYGVQYVQVSDKRDNGGPDTTPSCWESCKQRFNNFNFTLAATPIRTAVDTNDEVSISSPKEFVWAAKAHRWARTAKFWTDASATESNVAKVWDYSASLGAWLGRQLAMVTSGTVGICTATLNSIRENINSERTWIRGALRVVLALSSVLNIAVSVVFGVVRQLAALATGLTITVPLLPLIGLYNAVQYCRNRGSETNSSDNKPAADGKQAKQAQAQEQKLNGPAVVNNDNQSTSHQFEGEDQMEGQQKGYFARAYNYIASFFSRAPAADQQ